MVKKYSKNFHNGHTVLPERGPGKFKKKLHPAIFDFDLIY